MAADEESHVSFHRAYHSAVESLSAMKSEEEVSPLLDEVLLRKLLEASFAHQFDDDLSVLEKRVKELIEESIRRDKRQGSVR